MKNRILLLLFLFPVLSEAQKLIKCNDTISYFVDKRNDIFFSVKLIGKSTITDNPKVVNYQNTPVQILCIGSKDYQSNGSKDSNILSSYIYNETEYFTGVFKHKLELQADPIKLTDGKLAVLWYFDIPEAVQSSISSGNTPAVKIISISIVYQKYILSIGVTQFKNEKFELMKDLLINLIKMSETGKGDSDKINFCKKY